MMKYILLIFLTIFTLLFTSCSKPAPIMEKSRQAPSWFTNPKQNDAYFIYAVAGGKSSQEAISKALASMISKLSVNVQSTFNKQTTVMRYGRNSASNEVLKSNIKTEVAKIGISSYEVVYNEKLSYKNFIAMVKANKRNLTATLKKSLQAKIDLINTKIETINDQDPLKKLFSYKKAYEDATKLTTRIMVIGELDKNFNTINYLKYINTIYKKYLNVKKGINFYISSPDNALIFANKIKNALAQDYVVSKKNNKNSIKIICSINSSNSSTVIGNIANINVRIDVISKNKKIGGNSVLIKIKARGNKDTTMSIGALYFARKIKEKGIINILGIKL